MALRTIKIFKHDKKTVRKFEKLLPLMHRLENLLKEFIRKHDNRYWTAYSLEKIPRKKEIVDLALQDEMYELFQKLGWEPTTALAHKVAWQFKSVVELRKRGEYANLPEPIDFVDLKRFTITLMQNVKVKGRNISVRIGNRKFKQITINAKLPRFVQPERVKTVNVIWEKDVGITLDVVYEVEDERIPVPQRDGFISIDLGFHNFAAIVSDKAESIVVSGKPLQNFLAWSNEKLAELQKQHKWREYRRLQKYKRGVVTNFLYSLAHSIVDLAIQSNVGVIVVGDIGNLFQQKSKAKHFNRIFRQFSFGKFIHILKFLAEQYGILVHLQDEYNTSKESCIEGTKVVKRNRSELRLSDGKVVHADLNAAFNIAKKATGVCLRTTKELIRKLTRPIKVSFAKMSDLHRIHLALQSAFARSAGVGHLTRFKPSRDRWIHETLSVSV